MSKRKNYQHARRKQRRREKQSDVKSDIALGRACRRKYGGGLAK